MWWASVVNSIPGRSAASCAIRCCFVDTLSIAQCHCGVSSQRASAQAPRLPHPRRTFSLLYSTAPLGMSSPCFTRYYGGATTSLHPSRSASVSLALHSLAAPACLSLNTARQRARHYLDVVDPVSSTASRPPAVYATRDEWTSQVSREPSSCPRRTLRPRSNQNASSPQLAMHSSAAHACSEYRGFDVNSVSRLNHTARLIRCLRFMPASRLTMQNSLLAALAAALPHGIWTRLGSY